MLPSFLLGYLGDMIFEKENNFSLPSLGEISRPVLATGRTENIGVGVDLFFVRLLLITIFEYKVVLKCFFKNTVGSPYD